MRHTLCCFLLLTGIVGAAQPSESRREDRPLADTLVVMDLRAGIVGFTGHRWSVDPNGRWECARVMNLEDVVTAKGTLPEKEFNALVREVNKYNPAGLKGRTEIPVVVNPRRVIIRLGENTSELNLDGAGELPRPDPRTVGGRFAGIVEAVRKHIPPKNTSE